MANVIIADITNGGGLSPAAKSRQIAIDDNDRIYAAYKKKPGGYTYEQIYIAYSDDDGATWTEEQVGDSDVAHEEAPAIAIDSSNVLHLVFDGSGRSPYSSRVGVFYRQRSAAGVWGSEETVELLETAEESPQENASIAIDSNGDVHVVWQGDTTTASEINIKYRKRNGTWGSVEIVANSANVAQYEAALAIDSSDDVHVVWSGFGWGTNTTKANIRYRKRTTSWQSAEEITDTTESQELSSIAIDSSDVIHVVWDGKTWGTNSSVKNVQYRQKTGSWQSVEQVTDTAYQNRYPSIAVDSGDDVWASWDADTPSGTGELYIRRRSGTWGTTGHITEGLANVQVASSLLWATHPSGNTIADYMVVWEQDDNNIYFSVTEASTVTTQAVSSIAGETATGNGNITVLGSPNPTAHGVCYNTTGSPTTADSTTDEGGASSTGAFTSSMTSLSINTLYYVKAYATNITGTVYGSEVTFTTLGIPTVTSQTCESVVGVTATGRGEITVIGNPTPTAHGHCWNTTVNPTTSHSSVDNGAASAIGTFISSITGLTPGTAYYTRAYATNSQGTVYGANVYFVASTDRAGFTWDESSNLRSFDQNAIERQYIHTADVDDTPTNGATTDPISSNWAYDHVAGADPHTGYVLESLFGAQTVLQATSNNTPLALTVTEQTLVGRLTGENITAVAIGISDNNIAQIDGTSNAPANLDYAKFTTSGLEGKSYQELVNDISGVIKATDVEVAELSGADWDDVQDYINFFGDRTLLSGGAITDNGDGTVTVASGTAWAKATDSDTAVGKFFDFSADNSVSLTDMTTNHIYIDYNGGTPQIVVATDITTHGFKQDHIHIGIAFRDDTTSHFHETATIGIGRINRTDMHHREEVPVHRASGVVTSSIGTRNLSITTGVLYEGVSRHTTSPFDTSNTGTTDGADTNKLIDSGASFATTDVGKTVKNTTDTTYATVTARDSATQLTLDADIFTSGEGYAIDIFTYWYATSSGTVWNEVRGSTQISNTQYNDVTNGGLSNLTSNRYGVHWVYMEVDGGHFHVLYGQGNYKANQAEEASVPSISPDIVNQYCALIAKIIVQKDTDTLLIMYPWTDVFTSTLATDHNSLANLTTGDVHIQYFLLSGETTDAKLYSGADLIVYSDAGSTEVARIDGATGNITTAGTVDGIDIAAHATTKAANATLGHVIVETGSLIDVDGDGKLTLGAHDLAGSEHNAGSLSDLNSKISDATILDQGTVLALAIAL